MIEVILAVNNLGYIGLNNKLPWGTHRQDMDWFMENTLWKNVVMGYNTHISIGRKLLSRHNYILTSRDIKIKDCHVVNDIKDLPEDYIVIGGKIVYEQFFDIADKIYLSIINDDTIGDTRVELPEIDERFIIKRWS